LLAHATPGTTLALQKLELRGYPNGDKHELQWVIEANEPVTQQILEVSTDGVTFQPLTQAPNDERSYVYRPYNLSLAKYRLNVIFSDGRQYYSNVVTIRQNGTTPGPQLTGTMIRSNTIVVSSPGNYDYMILDVNGKILDNGKLVIGINNINARGMTSGMYLIRFADNNQQWTDKFIRQ
jgi:hypothetical protein